ncbi:MAG: hypothetical protein HRU24_05855 [Gammaproteobacteria bacterium]|nr:hypothetical protein [Gammaproteobacteria bacterium]
MKRNRCSGCGIPLVHAGVCPACEQEMIQYKIKAPTKNNSKFIVFFVGLIVFCAVMILYLPR